jgi:hypothetical protein
MKGFIRDLVTLTAGAAAFAGVYALGQLVFYGRVIW